MGPTHGVRHGAGKGDPYCPTYVRREFGLQAAQILLGRSKVDVTQIYAERDMNRAATVAVKIG